MYCDCHPVDVRLDMEHAILYTGKGACDTAQDEPDDEPENKQVSPGAAFQFSFHLISGFFQMFKQHSLLSKNTVEFITKAKDTTEE